MKAEKRWDSLNSYDNLEWSDKLCRRLKMIMQQILAVKYI